MARHNIVIIAGDGIGPEVMDATRRVIEASGLEVAWVERQAGMSALDRGLPVLPEETLAAVREHRIALKGPCTTPVGGGFTSVNVALRKRLDLYAAVRPVRNLPGVESRYQGVDIVVVRENTEGLYSGIENEITDGVVTSLKVATRAASERIAKFAFNYAIERGRRKVTVLHKANIMKLTDGLFIRCARRLQEKEFPQIDYDEVIIDAGAMRLVQHPETFDMLLCENLYGDVVSDLCAGLVGGLGVVPGANIGEHQAVFEAVHGTAPDIAGQGIANPLALIMSGVMMLKHLAETSGDPSCHRAAESIRRAYDSALSEGDKTKDLGGSLNTSQFVDAVIRRMSTKS